MDSLTLVRSVACLWIQCFCTYVSLVNCEKNAGAPQNAPFTPTPVSTTTPREWIELEVMGFRVWMIMGFVLVGLLIVVIALCCIFDCRIPRTKQQIEAENGRRQAAKAGFVKAAQKVQRVQKTMRMARGVQRAMAMQAQPQTVIAPPDPSSHDQEPHSIETDMSSASLMNIPEQTTSQTPPARIDNDFQLYEKPPNYGRRIVYQPGIDLGLAEMNANGSRQFRPDPDATAHALASLPRQANSRV